MKVNICGSLQGNWPVFHAVVCYLLNDTISGGILCWHWKRNGHVHTVAIKVKWYFSCPVIRIQDKIMPYEDC